MGYRRRLAVMRAIIIPLSVLLAGCVTSAGPDSTQRLGTSGGESPPYTDQRPAAEADSQTRRIAHVQELLALLGYAPGANDGIAGPATRSAMEKAARDLGVTVPDEPDARFTRTLETALNERVRTAQQQLAARGYDPGNADGHLGPRTRKALARFRADNGLPTSPSVVLDWSSPTEKRVAVASIPLAPPNPESPTDTRPESPGSEITGQEPLASGQRITVLLPGQKEASILTVGNDGTVGVPGMGPVQAAGRRPADIEKAIAVGFLDRYIATLVGAVRVDIAPP
jgi:peptidoglycan hydrolase-like protein with peptidoglycan-binding domain